jgi:hypothetical protein
MDFEVVHLAAIGTFGIDITVTPAGGSPTACRGIFRMTHQAVDPGTQAVVLIDQPTVDVRLDQMPGGDLKRDDAVTVNGVVYTVTEVRKDGEGMASAMLVLA